MDKTFVKWFRFKSGKVSSDAMEEMWREFADDLMEGRPIPSCKSMFFACCILDACDAYAENNGNTTNVHSEIAMSLGLRRPSGRQFSDEYAEADIYQAIVERMAKGEIDKKTKKSKTIGYKKAISKLFEEKHEALKAAKNTTQENIQRIYKKTDKMRKEFEADLRE